MTDNLTDYYAMESDLEGVESGLPDLPMSEVPTPVPETTAELIPGSTAALPIQSGCARYPGMPHIGDVLTPMKNCPACGSCITHAVLQR